MELTVTPRTFKKRPLRIPGGSKGLQGGLEEAIWPMLALFGVPGPGPAFPEKSHEKKTTAAIERTLPASLYIKGKSKQLTQSRAISSHLSKPPGGQFPSAALERTAPASLYMTGKSKQPSQSRSTRSRYPSRAREERSARLKATVC